MITLRRADERQHDRRRKKEIAGVTAEPAVSLTAREEAEILLVDVGERVPSSSREGG